MRDGAVKGGAATDFRPGPDAAPVTLQNALDERKPDARAGLRDEVGTLGRKAAPAGFSNGAHSFQAGGSFTRSQYKPSLLTSSEKLSKSTGFTM